ncbi:MAG TPA: hypothetical protein VH913_19335 [Hyphomicrobiaceae bacterium]|jgi:hypothetical protein
MTTHAEPEKLFTTKDFVELIRIKYLSAITVSRFEKDRMNGLTPEPAATYGNRQLYLAAQAIPYVEGLLARQKLERKKPKAEAASQPEAA